MLLTRISIRKAIAVTISTLIILVASVVLGTGVVLYGTSLFQTSGQTQAIQTQGVKLWVNGTNNVGYAWGAAAVRNSGDVLATVNTIQVRSASIPYTSWFVDTDVNRVGQNFQANFNFTKGDNNGNPKGTAATCGAGCLGPSTGTTCPQTGWGFSPTCLVIQVGPATGTSAVSPLYLSQQIGPTTLNPGGKMIVYFKVPNGLLTPVDSGSAVSVNILAGNVGGPKTVTVANP